MVVPMRRMGRLCFWRCLIIRLSQNIEEFQAVGAILSTVLWYSEWHAQFRGSSGTRLSGMLPKIVSRPLSIEVPLGRCGENNGTRIVLPNSESVIYSLMTFDAHWGLNCSPGKAGKLNLVMSCRINCQKPSLFRLGPCTMPWGDVFRGLSRRCGGRSFSLMAGAVLKRLDVNIVLFSDNQAMRCHTPKNHRFGDINYTFQPLKIECLRGWKPTCPACN